MKIKIFLKNSIIKHVITREHFDFAQYRLRDRSNPLCEEIASPFGLAMTMVRILILLCMVITVPVLLHAEKTFGLPNDYLQYGAGARSLAMGSAFTGVADDGSASYWNPAALAFLDEYQLLTMPYRMDTHYNYASIAMPFGPWGAVSVGDVMLVSGEFQERNDLNQVLGNDKSVMKNAVGVSYAYPFLRYFSAGVRVKFLQERVFSTAGDAFGLDGSLYSKPFYGISCGVAVNNINRPKITLIESPDVYGRHTRFGMAYHGKKDLFIVAVDANKLEEQSAYYTTGLEINPVEILSVRAGFNQQSEMTAGIGINMWPFTFDYAYSSHEELGVFNKLSVTLKWGNVYEARVEPMGMNRETGSILIKGLYNEVKFATDVPNFDIRQWELVIRDERKDVVRRLGGETRPPDTILWDMLDEAGQPVKRGEYQYTFKVEYYNDKEWVKKGSFDLNFNASETGTINMKVNGTSEELHE